MRQKLTLLAVLALASVTLVSGQNGALASVYVPFEFTIGDTVLPAGDYTVGRDNGNSILSFRGISGKKGSGVMVPIITRLAQLADGDSATLVFDKVGSRRYLSEVWAPGQDGYLVRRNADKHSHDVVHATDGVRATE